MAGGSQNQELFFLGRTTVVGTVETSTRLFKCVAVLSVKCNVFVEQVCLQDHSLVLETTIKKHSFPPIS